MYTRQATYQDTLKIIHAAANPRRRGGPYVLGETGAAKLFDKRALQIALHNHHQSKRARARRLKLLGQSVKKIRTGGPYRSTGPYSLGVG